MIIGLFQKTGIFDFFCIDPLKIHVFFSFLVCPLEFQRLLYPLEFPIDILNRGVTIFFSGKAQLGNENCCNGKK